MISSLMHVLSFDLLTFQSNIPLIFQISVNLIKFKEFELDGAEVLEK